MEAVVAARPRTSGYAWFVLAVLCVVYILNFLDRQLLSILAKPIQDDLGVTDGQLGRLGGLYFALFYCTISIPVGWLADRGNRVRVLGLACALWSAATLACGLSRNYGQLAVARMAVGVGEAGGAPPSYSIISDYFPPRMRGQALALFSLGVPLGQAMGVAFGAKIAAAYDWRTAFVTLGGVGIAAALAVVLLVREPKRGATDPALAEAASASLAQDTARFGRTFRSFFSNPVLVLTALAGGGAAFVGQAQLNFSTLFLMREKGMTLDEIAVYYALLLGLGMGGGGWLSGWLVDRFGQRWPQAYALVPAAALAIAAPLFVGFVHAPSWPVALAFLAGPISLNYFFLAPAIALVQNTVAPNQRTMSGALFLLLVNMIGLGLGPTFLGGLSDYFRAESPDHSLQLAFYALVPFYALAIGLQLLLARTIARAKRA
jgi:MFS family permease